MTPQKGHPDCNSDDNGMTVEYQLKQLPVATVFEKLNFPLKFERDKFVMDFSSGRSGSDPDTTPC